MKRHWFVWLSLWLSLGSLVSACGTGEKDSTTLETAAIVTPQAIDPTEGVSEKIQSEQETVYRFYAAVAEAEQEQKRALEARRRVAAERDRQRATRSVPRASQSNVTASGDLLFRLADCETNGGINGAVSNDTGDPYWGYFQWSPRTWWSLTHPRSEPFNYDRAISEIMGASYEEQRAVAAKIPVSAWKTQFPGCARKLGVA